MHTMVTEFHQIGPLLPPEPSAPPASVSDDLETEPPVQTSAPVPVPDENRPSERLLLQVNTFLVEHRWSPDVVRVQLVVTPLPGGGEALHQVLITHPAVAT